MYNGLFGDIAQHVDLYSSDGLHTRNFIDGLGRTYLTKASGPESKTIAFATFYDSRGAGRKTSLPYLYWQETPRYVVTENYAIGRVVRTGQESPADYIRTLVCYSKDVTVKIDPNNHRRREVRDASGRLIKVQEYTGTYSSCSTEEGIPYATTTYQYDVLGNLLFVTDAKGNQTEMKYDSLGRKRYMRDPDLGVWGYTYDNNGNLKTQTDAKGQTILFVCDELNRLKDKYHGTSLVMSNYYDETTSTNSVGRLSRMVDTTGQTVYNYDSMGRVTSSTKNIDGTAYNLGFTYANGRLESITYPDNEKVYYTYDAGYLKGVTGYIGYSNFDSLGRPWNATFGTGGASSLFSFDSATKRLAGLSVVSPNQGLLIDNSYGYDNKGNVTGITDNLNKPQQTNFSSESYTLDATRAHLIASTASGRVFTPDANGNITNDGLRGIAYNFDNMPTTVNSTSFTYDGNSTRVKKYSSGLSTIYIDKLFECTNGTCTKYIFAGNTRVAKKVGNQISFFHPDHQGGTSVITDVAGNKVNDIAHYPFGGTRQESGSTSGSHKYTGQELDVETGLYNYNARLYDPEIGRFMSPDSIVPDPTNPQSLNRYAYVLNNPMNYTDPSGHSFLSNPLGSINDWMFDKATTMISNPGKTMNYISKINNGILIAEGVALTMVAGPEFGFATMGGKALATLGAAIAGYGVDSLGGDAEAPPSATVPIMHYNANEVDVLANVGGKVWNSPNTALGLTIGGVGLILGGDIPSIGNNAIQFTNNPLNFGLGAITLGNTISYGRGSDPSSIYKYGTTFGQHEYQHTFQGEQLGPLYIPSNILGMAAGLLVNGNHHGPANWNESGPESTPPRPWRK